MLQSSSSGLVQMEGFGEEARDTQKIQVIDAFLLHVF